MICMKNPAKYSVNVSFKVPLPDVPYSSVQTSVTVSDDDYDIAKGEAHLKALQLLEETIDTWKNGSLQEEEEDTNDEE